MLRLRCPVCQQVVEVGRSADLPSFPFCSGRCKTIDLGRWLDERYPLPATPEAPPTDIAEELLP